MKILEDPHQDPQRSLHRSLKILKDLKKIFTRVATWLPHNTALKQLLSVTTQTKHYFYNIIIRLNVKYNLNKPCSP